MTWTSHSIGRGNDPLSFRVYMGKYKEPGSPEHTHWLTISFAGHDVTLNAMTPADVLTLAALLRSAAKDGEPATYSWPSEEDWTHGTPPVVPLADETVEIGETLAPDEQPTLVRIAD